MNRINVEAALPGAAVLFGIFAGGCESAPEKAPAEFEKPNITYIIADDRFAY